MNQAYLVVEFPHAVQGRIKRVQVSYKVLAYIFCSFLVVAAIIFGLLSSYAQMTWKMSNYNQLSADFDRLRNRYQELQKVSRQHSEQMASLETLATEVSVAYGISEPARSTAGKAIASDKLLTPTVKETMDQYNFLAGASLSSGIYNRYAYQWQSHTQPSLWPVHGVLRSAFGVRSDPLSGEGAFHTGIDLSVPMGTPVHASADGVVTKASWGGDYGRLVVVDHGNGLETYYAHLSHFTVVAGQAVSRGQIIALSGETGRATGPHMHYEVRLHGTPVNPYKFLGKVQLAQAPVHHDDLGLGSGL